MQYTLKEVSEWAKNSGLNINPKKTELVLFTRRKINFDTPKLQQNKLKLSDSAKFLGVMFTPTLNWKPHIEERAKKAQAALYACRSSIGKTWGLSPVLKRWM